MLFYNLALLVLRLICSLPFYAGQLPPSSFISHNLHTPGLWISFCVCVFLLLLPRRRVFSLVLSCSRSYHMSILLFLPPPFRCVYFLSDLSSFSFVYIPFSTFCSPNPVLSYLHPFTELLIERTFSPFSTPFFIPSYIYLDVNPKKISRNLG